MIYKPEEVLTEYERAVGIARRMPKAKPDEHCNYWPEILRNSSEGYQESIPSAKVPSAVELDDYKRIAGWMGFIADENTRRFIWLYAAGMPGWRICKMVSPHVSQSTVSRRIVSGLAKIAFELDQGHTPPEIRLSENIS